MASNIFSLGGAKIAKNHSEYFGKLVEIFGSPSYLTDPYVQNILNIIALTKQRFGGVRAAPQIGTVGLEVSPDTLKIFISSRLRTMLTKESIETYNDESKPPVPINYGVRYEENHWSVKVSDLSHRQRILNPSKSQDVEKDVQGWFENYIDSQYPKEYRTGLLSPSYEMARIVIRSAVMSDYRVDEHKLLADEHSTVLELLFVHETKKNEYLFVEINFAQIADDWDYARYFFTETRVEGEQLPFSDGPSNGWIG